jgi:hypothetical protein
MSNEIIVAIIAGIFLLVSVVINVKMTNYLTYKITKKHFGKNFAISKSYCEPDWQEKFKLAKNDIFLSSITLIRLNGQKHLLEEMNNNIYLRLLSLDISDESFTCFCKMRSKDFTGEKERYKITKASYIETIRKSVVVNKSNIHERVAARIIPCNFFAVDILKESENSFIEVCYLLAEKKVDDSNSVVSFTAARGTELFNILREQIELYWGEAKDI